ncbi:MULTISPECIES: hypothetical protein [unclassified Microbacterium]|uniref:hypothetical protein n=1 Tax=unclassified Microbacterium TaxID=2609290 RepID=UPI000F55957D|nr:hypothetical protein [Microbacterium sp. ABRD28]AZC14924.1 hypothetical protein DT073_15440 [Microbacterium sp. ABRD28]
MAASRPVGVTIVAVLAWISGFFNILGGALILIGGALGQGPLLHLVLIAILTIILGVIIIAVSVGLLRGSPGARLVVTIVFVLNIVSAVLLIIGGAETFWTGFFSALPAIIGLILLYTRRANAFFGG